MAQFGQGHVNEAFELDKHKELEKPSQPDLLPQSSSLGAKERPTKYPEELPPAKSSSWKSYLGIFFALLSTIFYSLSLITVKLIPLIHPITQSIWRYGVYTLLNTMTAIGLLIYERRSDRDKEPQASAAGDGEGVFQNVFPNSTMSTRECWSAFGKLMIAGSVGCAGNLLKTTALNYMTVADAITVTYMNLVWILLLAHFCIGEKCSVVSTLMAGCIILGIGIITRPPFLTGATGFDKNLMIGLCFKMVDTFCTAISVISVRTVRHFHFIFLSFWMGTIGLVFTTITSFSLQLFVMPTSYDEIGLLVGLGVLHCFANICVILALKFEKVGPVSLLRTANVPLVFLWQIVILGIFPDKWTILGSVLVSFGVIATSGRKWVEELPAESRTRKKLRICLT